MQCFWSALVGQPDHQRGFILGCQSRGVDIGAVAVGGRDGQRGGITVVDGVRPDHRKTGSRCPAGMFGQPGCHRAGRQGVTAHLEPILDLRFGRGQGVK